MKSSFTIDNQMVGADCKPFIIAEAGINHNGDLATALAMIDAAVEAEVDAVKFQTFHTEDFIDDKFVMYEYKSQGSRVSESMFDMFKRTEFSDSEWKRIKEYCDKLGITFLSTPVSMDDLRLLKNLGIGAIKVGSDDFNNTPLITQFSKCGLPLLLSCGMANDEEMKRTITIVSRNNDCICLFLCTSQYPTPAKDVNARKLLEMRNLFPEIVLGFSDHTEGSTAAIVATALGAQVFEKHFTLDHNMPGPDHWFASNPAELKEWAYSIRQAHLSLGSSSLQPTESEIQMRALARRSVVALANIAEGEILCIDNIGLRRPGTGIEPSHFNEIVGKTALRNISKGSQLEWVDFN